MRANWSSSAWLWLMRNSGHESHEEANKFAHWYYAHEREYEGDFEAAYREWMRRRSL